jgi:hypothetical protein
MGGIFVNVNSDKMITHQSVLKIAVNLTAVFCILAFVKLLFFRSWMTTVKPTLTGLNASLLVRNPATRKLRVNYDPKIRETLHEAEYLMKLNLEIGPLALNLCMSEDHLKTTRDS